ncbi:MAG: hypothetical protein IT361_00765 [Gemmatimonadaceae bacterium]|nr:hypothetical protein [Gemmatimonadaceae bacterium]
MTPEPLFVVEGATLSGSWRQRRVAGTGALHLYPTEGQLLDEAGRHLALPWDELTDCTWERETLALHGHGGVLHLSGPRELGRAWGLIVAQACALPEVARGLRTLGTARGGSAVLQSRFFGPLLAARRRLQEPEPIERRVTQFDPVALAQRLHAAVAEIAAERHPESASRRRALEAHLQEALEPLEAQLDALRHGTDGLHQADPGYRFIEWRLWTRRLRRVFLEADRAWANMVRQLETR